MSEARVLIVEDEPIIAEDLKASLTKLGYDVAGVVHTGERAVESARINSPDIVLMDITLGGDLDGVETAEQIMTDFQIPVVYLTAHSDLKTLQRAMKTEPYGYIVKPFKERELQIAAEMALYKHRAESQMKRMDRWLSTTLNSIGDGVIATDVSGAITFFNPVASQLTQRKKEDVTGKMLQDTIQILDEKTMAPLTATLEKALHGGEFIPTSDAILVLPDNREIPIEHTIAWIRDDKGEILGMVLVFRDVTERRRAEIELQGRLQVAEVKYRSLVEQIPVVTYIALGTDILFVSPQCQSILGYSQNELLGDQWSMCLHSEDMTRVVREKSHLNSQQPYISEYRFLGKDGRIVWVRDEALMMRTRDDQPLFLQGVLLDVTDRKAAEIQIQKSHEQLRALSLRLQEIREEERTRISREIHDELGQILTAIRMNLSLLNLKFLDSSDRLPRQQLISEISGLIDVVDRAINTVRRIASELRPDVLDHLGLKAAIEYHVQEFQSRTGIDCEFRSEFDMNDFDPDCATAVFRILQETLTNVARHSRATHVNVRLYQEARRLILEVKDNGQGMADTDLQHSRSLGLLGMRERATGAGGTLEIRSTPGQGTTVTLVLPLPDCSD